MFTNDNTDGQFSEIELQALNEASTIIADRNPELRDYSIRDALTNAWTGSQTAVQLADATGF
jgi:hypothetical protein